MRSRSRRRASRPAAAPLRPNLRPDGGTAREDGLQRTLAFTVGFAISAVLVTALGATFAYRGVRGAIEIEFEWRLERIVRRAASQIAPADVRDPAVRSSE